MPPRTRKKKPKAIAVLETKSIVLDDLQMYHKNPRIGNVEAIASSLRENGQFKPIVVNVGTLTGRKNEILAGNHTYLGMKKNGERMIYASFVDVSEEQATKIVLADNKTADLGTYDEKIIADLFESLPDVAGTGYSQDEIDELLKQADAAVTNVLTGLEEESAAEEEQREKDAEDEFGASLSDVEEDDEDDGDLTTSSFDPDEDEEDDSGPKIENQSDELPGLAELKEGLDQEDTKIRIGPWGVTRLRQDMLMTFDEIPAGLKTWAGSASKEHAQAHPEQWWFYNWGIDSTSGMKDISKVIVAFYTWDEYFENWYWDPRKYVTKLLNSGIKYMATPDFSTYPTYPPYEWLSALYRSRYVGRFAQEAGIKIIPTIEFPPSKEIGRKFLKDHVLATLPKKVPLITMQLHNYVEDDTVYPDEEFIKDWQLIVDTVKPEGMLIYGSGPGATLFKREVKYDGKLLILETRNVALAEKAKRKERKRTI